MSGRVMSGRGTIVRAMTVPVKDAVKDAVSGRRTASGSRARARDRSAIARRAAGRRGAVRRAVPRPVRRPVARAAGRDSLPATTVRAKVDFVRVARGAGSARGTSGPRAVHAPSTAVAARASGRLAPVAVGRRADRQAAVIGRAAHRDAADRSTIAARARADRAGRVRVRRPSGPSGASV